VLSLPGQLSRYAAVATLLLKHRSAPADAEGADAEALARDLEKLGPTFVKLGQLLSTRSDLLPPPYTAALSRLQDDVAPFPFAEVERLIQEELGARMSKAFGMFEREPIAAASLGQVHCAALRDGLMVAVKVQRPDARDRVTADLKTLEQIAELLDHHTSSDSPYDFSAMVSEFKRTLLEELDYTHEAANLKTLGRNLSSFPSIVIPQPVSDYCTCRVLTMDYVLGTKVTRLSPLARIDMNAEHLGRDLIRAYLHQIIVDGCFHADPHPGNVFVTDDQRLALVDLGMVGRLSAKTQGQLLRLLLAVAEGQSEDASDVLVELGERCEHFDEAAFRREIVALVTTHHQVALQDIQVGRLLLTANQMAAAHGLKPPTDLSLLGKTLLNLDGVARELSPRLDVNAVIREESATLMRERMLRSVSPAGLVSTMLDAKQFAEKLPGRVNRVLDSLARNELRLKVEMIDEGALITGLQKVANRIALGLVMAALIVGAALLMQVPTTFRVFGYPGLAIILFLIAASAGAMLVVQIVTHDRTTRLSRK
jgi:predicted unusual protein kinase regulating ubiquinone biosynthesis (AarF/ABC1/UbiB family)